MFIHKMPPLYRLDALFTYCSRSGMLRRLDYIDMLCRQQAGGPVLAVNRDGSRGRVSVDGVKHHASRICYKLGTGEEPSGVVDHIDGDIGNNRICNLRDVSHAENARNRGLYQSTTGIMGVLWRDDCNKYRAQIRVDGKEVHLGLFNTKKEAARVRKMAEREHGFHENHGSDRG